VEFRNPRLRRRQLTPGDRLAVASAGLFITAIGAWVLLAKLHWAVLALYAALSLATFRLYSLDKAAAEKGRWRTSEGTLLLWGLLGGWPGALIAQKVRRHKSRKQPFQFFFWITVAVNCGVLVGLGTAVGRTFLLDLLRKLP
jgi:uncharacterized membrane protein YsdA (DUF1294 family)